MALVLYANAALHSDLLIRAPSIAPLCWLFVPVANIIDQTNEVNTFLSAACPSFVRYARPALTLGSHTARDWVCLVGEAGDGCVVECVRIHAPIFMN